MKTFQEFIEGVHPGNFLAKDDKCYIDYSGGRFVAWYYADGDTIDFGATEDIKELMRQCAKLFKKIVLTATAEKAREYLLKTTFLPAKSPRYS